MSEHSAVIRVEGLRRSYGAQGSELAAVDSVSFQVSKGEVVLIFGPSGCGKSTLLRILGGLDRDFEGQVELFGEDLKRLSDKRISELRGRRVGFVFQSFHLLPHLSVLDNVTTPQLFLSHPLSKAELHEKGLSMLEKVGLKERASASPAQLSGGQRQRVAIARALLNDPDLLLCDEPTGNLDRDTGAQIIDLFSELHRELGVTQVVVTHEERLLPIGDRVLEMVDGKIERDASGKPTRSQGDG